MAIGNNAVVVLELALAAIRYHKLPIGLLVQLHLVSQFKTFLDVTDQFEYFLYSRTPLSEPYLLVW